MLNPGWLHKQLENDRKTIESLPDWMRTRRSDSVKSAEEERMWSLFHKLWGKDQETSTYDKQKWMDLESAILEVMKKRPTVRYFPWYNPQDIDWESELGDDHSLENMKRVMIRRLPLKKETSS